MIRLLFVVLIFGLIFPSAASQITPLIVSFDSDVTAITPDEAESGVFPVTLTWETKNLRPADRLQIEVLVLDQWQVIASDTILDAQGSLEHTVPHTLSFDAPTFRLAILDQQSELVAEKVLVIPYIEPDAEPEIVSFTSPQKQLNKALLQKRALHVEVEWQILNRPVDSNVTFTQIFADGQSISIELPREFLWVRSSGMGVVLPTLSDGKEVRIQLSLVDRVTGELYTQSEILFPVVETMRPANRTAPATVIPPVSQTVFFTSNTQNARPGDTIILSWETEGVNEARIDVIAATPRPGGHAGVGVLQSFDVAPDGSMSFTMGDYFGDSVIFALMLDTHLGAGQSPNMTTTVNEIQAP